MPQAPDTVHPLAELANRYLAHAPLQAFAQGLAKAGQATHAIQNLSGSQRALVLHTIQHHAPAPALIIAEDREDAHFLLSDLEPLAAPGMAHLFPASSKSAYQLERIDNANVLARAEVLSAINNAPQAAHLLITYPEALFEKVINRTSLVQHTLTIHRGEAVDQDFLLETLEHYGFEEEDFVYEPGQYAIRGGLVDVFSFASERPYRVEFNDEVVERMRTFDPESQLSEDEVESIHLMPNVQTRLMEEERVSLLEYLPAQTRVFAQNLRLAQEEVGRLSQRAEAAFQALMEETGQQTRRSSPEALYYTEDAFKADLATRCVVELGRKPLRKPATTYDAQGQPAPPFKKAYDLLADHLTKAMRQHTVYVAAEQPKQLERLREILHEKAHKVDFMGLQANFQAGWVDKALGLEVFTDHQLFGRYPRFRHRQSFTKSAAITLKELIDLKPGDYVTHINHGVGRFAGLHRVDAGGQRQEVIKLIFDGGDELFVPVSSLFKLSKYAGSDSQSPKLNKLGSAEWQRTKAKVKKRLRELTFDLVQLYAQRKSARGHASSPDGYLMNELEASFPYEETPDQLKAMDEVRRDMEATSPMDRLVCGDVGFGKTEVALRAAFKAAVDGKQVAVLVPTTVLALQHYRSFAERFADFPIRVAYLNRLQSAKEQKDVLKALKDGQVDIVVGTHRLLSKDVGFKDLGLLVIDEEHKFGVAAKEKLRLLRVNVDTLALTATPIPRTLQMSLLAIRDFSVIATPPPNRQPVDTQVFAFDQVLMRDAIAYELRRGGQVFFIHPRVRELESIASNIKQLVPDARVGFVHGQMDPEKLERTMEQVIEGQVNVLVATKLVESGLDISNVNTIIINQAHMFGLSELHQLRGRVGRSNRKAYCYLFAPPISTLPTDSRKRLEAMETFTELGSGFQIAMKDLDIRGAGDILGSEQSGFIADIGYDMYHRLLDETIRELKAEHFPDLQLPDEDGAQDVQVDVEDEAFIPEAYLPGTAERLNFYRRISEATNEDQLRTLARELQDRFGLMPQPVLTLFDTVRLRELGGRLGFSKVVVRGGSFRAYFAAENNAPYYHSPTFQHILAYVQQHPDRLKLAQIKGRLALHMDKLYGLKEGLFLLQALDDQVRQGEGALGVAG